MMSRLLTSLTFRGGSRGRSIAPLKPTKNTFFTMILNNSENSIRDVRSFCRALFCHSSRVKYTSSLLQKWTRNDTWLPNITEIVPPKLTGWIRPCSHWHRSVPEQQKNWASCCPGVKRLLIPRCIYSCNGQCHTVSASNRECAVLFSNMRT